MSFRPRDVGSTYLSWPKLPALAALEPINGLMEKRGGALIDIDRAALAARMKTYFDSTVDWATLELTAPQLARDASGHKAEKARKAALKEETYDASRVVRYIARPFDVRHAYYTNVSTIWNRARPELWTQFSGGNQFLMTRKSGVADPEGPPTLFTQCLTDDHCLKTDAFLIPFRKHDAAQGMLTSVTAANLSAPARTWLAQLGLPDPDTDPDAAAAPWRHALAITYAPQYLGDNADGIAIDWPRVPLPDQRELLDNSAALGAEVADLLIRRPMCRA